MKKIIVKRLNDVIYVFDERLGLFGKGATLDEAFDALTEADSAQKELMNELDLEHKVGDLAPINLSDLQSNSKRFLDGVFFSFGFASVLGVMMILGSLFLIPKITNEARNLISNSEFVLKSAFYDSMDGGGAPRCYRCIVQAVARSLAQDLQNASPEEKAQLERDITIISEYYRSFSSD